VASLVALGLVPPAGADALITAVLQQVGPPPLRGDIDRDGDVDLTDLNFILRERGKPVSVSSCGVACDLDNDGRISALDARILVTLCTRLQCAIQ
jgi:Dockerin type I domain